MNYPNKSLVVGLCLAALAPFGVSSLSASSIIASYEFTDGSAAATASDSDITASDFTLGAGLTEGISSSSDSIFVRSTETFGSMLSFTNARDNDDYFTVTFTAGTDISMDLTTFSYDYGYTSATGSKELKSYVTTSINNHESFFTAGGANAISTVNTTVTSTATFPNALSLDLTHADLNGAYQNITTSIEFRIYFSDDHNNSQTIHRLDNVQLSGTLSAVPESQAFALLGGLMAIGFVAVRRPRKA